MGLIFCSRARSFEASSHSFEIVLGGGGATRTHETRRAFQEPNRGVRTDRTNAIEQDRRGDDEAGHAQNDLRDGAGRVDGCTGAVGAERNVVRCSSTHTRQGHPEEYGVSKKPSYVKGRER